MGGAAWAEKLELPASLTKIEEEAFYGDKGLKEVVLPDGLKRIEELAFADSSVTRVYLPESIEYIAENAFDGTKATGYGAEGTYASQFFDRKENLSFEGLTSPVDDFTFSWNGKGTCSVKKYLGTDTEIIIPGHDANGNLVTEISAYAFNGKKEITNVIIPDSVTEIGDSAFYNCVSLKHVKLPKELISLERESFARCESLTSVEIPENVITIGQSAFEGCKALTEVILHDQIETIGVSAFSDAELTSLHIPKNIKSIERWAFDSCSKVKELVFPDTLEYLGFRAFPYYGGTKMYANYESNTAKLLSADGRVFYDEKHFPGMGLKHVMENGEAVGLSLEEWNLEDSVVRVPDDFTRIGNDVFSNHDEIVSIYLPESVHELGSSVFGSSKEVFLPDHITQAGRAWGQGDTWLYTKMGTDTAMSMSMAGYGICDVDFSPDLQVQYIFDDDQNITGMQVVYANPEAEEIYIPEGVTRLGYRSMVNASALKTVHIPESIEYIDEAAFHYYGGCQKLERVYLPGDYEDFTKKTFEKDSFGQQTVTIYTAYDGKAALKTSRLGFYFIDEKYGPYTLRYNFNDNGETTGMTLLKGLDDTAEIIIPKGVTEIGDWAFSDLKALRHLRIPSWVRKVGVNIVSAPEETTEKLIIEIDGLPELTSEYTTVPLCSFGTSYSHTRINQNIVVYAKIGSELSRAIFATGKYFRDPSYPELELYYGYNGLVVMGCDQDAVNVVVPPNTVEIERKAFSECGSLTNVFIPDSVTSIGEKAFYESGLVELRFPSGLLTISDSVCDGCRSLERIYLPSGLKKIEQYAFYNCSSLKYVTIPDSVEELHKMTFQGCSSLEWIYIPDGIKEIPYQFLTGTSSLREMRVPESVESIYGTNSNGFMLEGCKIYGIAGSFAERYVAQYGRATFTTDPWPHEDANEEANTRQLTIQGIIATKTGIPVENVYITVTRKGYPDEVHSTISNDAGVWSVELTKDDEYQISYWHMDYQITGDTTAKAGDTLKAVAVLTGDEDSQSSFRIMQDNKTVEDGQSVLVGTSVDFIVSAVGAKGVQLVVDGKAYEQYPVIDGVATFSRVFSSAGTREIKFRLYKEEDAGHTTFTPAKRITLRSNGTLEKANIHDIGTWALDSDTTMTITWDAVEHADSYRVYFYYDGCRYYPTDENSSITYTTGTSFTLLAEYPLWASDKWSVEVVASGKGWSSSTGTKTFSAVGTSGSISILTPQNEYQSECNETIAISIARPNNNQTLDLRIYKPDGTGVDAREIRNVGNMFYYLPDISGIYRIVATMGEEASERTFHVKEPTITNFSTLSGIRYGDCLYQIGNSDVEFRVSYDFIPDSVELWRDGSLVENSRIENNGRNWSFILQDNLPDANYIYEYWVRATYCSGKTIQTDKVTVVSMTENDNAGGKWYLKEDAEIIPIPLDGSTSLNSISLNSAVRILNGEYSEFWLVEYKGVPGFVNKNVLTDSLKGDDVRIKILRNDAEKGFIFRGESVEILIQADEIIEEMKVRIEYIPASQYASVTGKVYLSTETCERIADTNMFEYKTWLGDKLGTYYLSFIPECESVEIGQIAVNPIVMVDSIDDNGKKSAYFRERFGKNISILPFSSELINIDEDDAFIVLGKAANDPDAEIVLISATADSNMTIYGYVPADQLEYMSMSSYIQYAEAGKFVNTDKCGRLLENGKHNVQFADLLDIRIEGKDGVVRIVDGICPECGSRITASDFALVPSTVTLPIVYKNNGYNSNEETYMIPCNHVSSIYVDRKLTIDQDLSFDSVSIVSSEGVVINANVSGVQSLACNSLKIGKYGVCKGLLINNEARTIIGAQLGDVVIDGRVEDIASIVANRLTVNGYLHCMTAVVKENLTANGTMRPENYLECGKDLTVRKNASISMWIDGKTIECGGNLIVENDASIQMFNPLSSIKAGGNVVINGQVGLLKVLDVEGSLTIGKTGAMELKPEYTITVKGNLNFSSTKENKGISDPKATINVYGDVEIDGNNFKLDGNLVLKSVRQKVTMKTGAKESYIGAIKLTYPVMNVSDDGHVYYYGISEESKIPSDTKIDAKEKSTGKVKDDLLYLYGKLFKDAGKSMREGKASGLFSIDTYVSPEWLSKAYTNSNGSPTEIDKLNAYSMHVLGKELIATQDASQGKLKGQISIDDRKYEGIVREGVNQILESAVKSTAVNKTISYVNFDLTRLSSDSTTVIATIDKKTASWEVKITSTVVSAKYGENDIAVLKGTITKYDGNTISKNKEDKFEFVYTSSYADTMRAVNVLVTEALAYAREQLIEAYKSYFKDELAAFAELLSACDLLSETSAITTVLREIVGKNKVDITTGEMQEWTGFWGTLNENYLSDYEHVFEAGKKYKDALEAVGVTLK